MIRALCTDLDRSIIHEYLPFTTVNCGGSKKGIAHTTLEIMEELQNFGVVIILATTRRLANFQKVKEVIPHHFAILEDGGVIIDKESAVFEKEWMLHLQPWIGTQARSDAPLWRYVQQLRKMGFSVDDDGRFASACISRIEDSDPDEIYAKLPQGLSICRNGKRLILIPKTSGKYNALQFIIAKKGIVLEEVAALGDDENDGPLLKSVGYPHTFCDARASVVALVRQRKGFIAAQRGHEGAKEILKHILEIYKGG